MEQEAGAPTLIGSIQRALRIAEIVAASSRPVPAKALASASGLTLGTCYNIARTLVHEGYLSREPDGFVVGPGFPGFGAAPAAGVAFARGRASLRDVARTVGATAYLSRYEDGEIRITDVVEGAGEERLDLWVGISDSAHATALGKQILAELPAAERRDYVARHPLASLTPHTINDRRALLATLERGADAVVDRQEYAIGYTCVAVPVRAPSLFASLAVALPERRAGAALGEAVAALRRAAARLSVDLAVSGAAGAAGAREAAGAPGEQPSGDAGPARFTI